MCQECCNNGVFGMVGSCCVIGWKMDWKVKLWCVGRATVPKNLEKICLFWEKTPPEKYE